MAKVTPMKAAITLKMNMGTDTEGNVKTANMTFPGSGKLDFREFGEDDIDASVEKVNDIVNAIKPYLSRAVYSKELSQQAVITKNS